MWKKEKIEEEEGLSAGKNRKEASILEEEK